MALVLSKSPHINVPSPCHAAGVVGVGWWPKQSLCWKRFTDREYRPAGSASRTKGHDRKATCKHVNM